MSQKIFPRNPNIRVVPANEVTLKVRGGVKERVKNVANREEEVFIKREYSKEKSSSKPALRPKPQRVIIKSTDDIFQPGAVKSIQELKKTPNENMIEPPAVNGDFPPPEQLFAKTNNAFVNDEDTNLPEDNEGFPSPPPSPDFSFPPPPMEDFVSVEDNMQKQNKNGTSESETSSSSISGESEEAHKNDNTLDGGELNRIADALATSAISEAVSSYSHPQATKLQQEEAISTLDKSFEEDDLPPPPPLSDLVFQEVGKLEEQINEEESNMEGNSTKTSENSPKINSLDRSSSEQPLTHSSQVNEERNTGNMKGTPINLPPVKNGNQVYQADELSNGENENILSKQNNQGTPLHNQQSTESVELMTAIDTTKTHVIGGDNNSESDEKAKKKADKKRKRCCILQ